ncbi:MAG: FAD synthetase family protein, partial [bacterium]
MKIYSSLGEKFANKGAYAVLTLGCFDGVHMGHRAIIERVIAEAQKTGGLSGLLTFDPHPLEVLNKTDKAFLLSTREEKEKILAGYPLDFITFIPFTRQFASLPPEAFVKDILVEKFKAKKVIVGQDTRFGYRGAGTVSLLKSLGNFHNFDVDVIEPVLSEGDVISSSLIRGLLEAGEIDRANRF